MSKKMKMKLRIDRLCVLLVVCLMIVFGIYKGISGIVSLFQNNESEEFISFDPNKEYAHTIIIDPGHGGYDVGTHNGSLLEKDITFKVSKVIARELDDNNIKVIMTRRKDIALAEEKKDDLQKRVEFSKEYQAELFVSLHVNAFKDDETIHGYEAHIADDQSKSLADNIMDQIDQLDISKNRGIFEKSTIYVIKNSSVKACLIEMGYIHSTDQLYLSDDEKLEELGKAIARGVLEEFNEE